MLLVFDHKPKISRDDKRQHDSADNEIVRAFKHLVLLGRKLFVSVVKNAVANRAQQTTRNGY